MFCSFCKKIEALSDFQRKMCNHGHIACNNCAVHLHQCPECLCNFTKNICIENTSKAPRIYIADFEHQNMPAAQQNLDAGGDASGMQNSPASLESDDIAQIIFELNKCEDRKNVEASTSTPSVPTIVNCFEVLYKKPSRESLISVSMNTEEEREIRKYFKVCRISSSVESKQMLPKVFVSVAPKGHRSVQTSNTQLDEIIKIDKMSQQTKDSDTKSYVRSISGSQDNFIVSDCNDDKSSSTITSESVVELYTNHKLDAATAHFTSVTVSDAPTPPVSPRKTGVPTLAHRVRVASSFEADGGISAQMEPMNIIEIETSEIDVNLPSDKNMRIPRHIVRCPITNCEHWGVPSDFCNHMTIDHPHVENLKVSPGNLINMNINHSSGNSEMVLCRRLFLLTGKIVDIGYGSFKNCLPITLLTAKLSLRKAFGCTTINKTLHDENLYFWLEGAYQFPVHYTLTLFAHCAVSSNLKLLKNISTQVASMSTSFSPRKIIGNSLALSNFELQKLSENGCKMIVCQIIFH